jgi:Replication-relaxation
VLQAADAAGPLRAHTLAVNDAAICFLKAARERGDEFGPFSWRQEVAHPMSRGRGRRRRTLFADAVLTYLRPEDNDTVLELRFLELDRATLSVDRLVAELSRYAQLYRATDAEGQPLWRDRYPVFPRVLCVLTGASREALTTRRTFASMLLRDHPAMAQARGEVAVSFCRLEDLLRKGPFAPIFREARDRERPVDWLGNSPDDEEER